MLRVACLVLLCLICAHLWAQECDDTRPRSTPVDNFFLNHDGTVTELETGLTWMRCAFGQTWNGFQCAGSAKRLTWQQAQNEAGRKKNAKWRLPTLAELATIVERQCVMPRINQQLFPNTPDDVFWTASNKRGIAAKAYALDFAYQGVTIANQDERFYIRFVSGRD